MCVTTHTVSWTSSMSADIVCVCVCVTALAPQTFCIIFPHRCSNHLFAPNLGRWCVKTQRGRAVMRDQVID